MSTYLKQGWRLTVKHLAVAVALFLYRLLWGFFLYRYVDSIIGPLLRRYPGANEPSQGADALFWAEAQFRLMKTDLAQPVLWTLAALLLSRMIVTPLINAGLFYSIHHTAAGHEGGTLFLQGMRKAWKPVLLLYWAETLLAAAPLWWLGSRARDVVKNGSSLQEIAVSILPWAAAWLLWIGVLHLLSLSLQFGAVSRLKVSASLSAACRRLLPMAGLSLILLLFSGIIGAGFSAAAMAWAGLAALVIQQAYHLVRTLLDLWLLTSQYACWEDSRHIS
ncbi:MULTISPECIES: hypothetical protein [unclassified Paenibacillus]|uniref:hypothetical protein n=1 Tax=unclassified Paenibacillus TaxID=185978 RepID=UPI0009551599|nr:MULTISPECIES: hypothetical protein [unclassified Paenibacillus]ASS67823.1 hypothetical protein CIC07_17990 [Paenibacillus sp. RUD330]SIR59947.1 hypothetical protein SAMN05880555_4374 [Paenibacillus sp. RU4X]SIR68758.1 hypothetical protein SAMN05880570_4376 [Paenibacillus sp. RU4T]